MMDEHDIETLAAAMNQLRPDWPASSLRTFIAKNLASRAKRDVCVALAWIACEPNTSTPARVLEAGPWWKAAGVTGELTRRHPVPTAACRTCGRDVNSHGGPDSCDSPTTRPEARDPAWQSSQAAKARALLHPERGPA